MRCVCSSAFSNYSVLVSSSVRVLGVGLTIAPVAAGNVPLLPAEVPAETIAAGLVVLVVAYAQRVREVDVP